MISVTVADIASGARLRADMGDTSWLSDSDAVSLVRSAWEHLYVAVASTAWGARRWTTSTTGTTVAGTDTYALPSSVWRVEGVDVQDGSTWRQVPQRAWHERDDYQSAYVELSGAPVVYDLVGGNIVFAPVPAGATAYRIWYTPDPTTVSGLGTTLSLEPAWREWLELSVGAAALRREESYEQAAALQGHADGLWAAILGANTRNVGDAEHVRDVVWPDL